MIKPSETKEKAIGKVDDLLELYMGIRDIDLGKIILFKKVLYVLILWNLMLIYVLLAFIVNILFKVKSICGVIKTIMKMKIIYKSKKNTWPLSLTSFEA